MPQYDSLAGGPSALEFESPDSPTAPVLIADRPRRPVARLMLDELCHSAVVPVATYKLTRASTRSVAAAPGGASQQRLSLTLRSFSSSLSIITTLGALGTHRNIHIAYMRGSGRRLRVTGRVGSSGPRRGK